MLVYTVTLNPALDKTVAISGFTAGRVNYVEQIRMDPGGKGINISKVLKGLGGNSIATGILGGATGRYIKKCLNEMSIEHEFLYVKQDTRTNLKIVDLQKRQNTDINEPGRKVSGDTVQQVLTKIMEKAAPGDIVVLAGRAPFGMGDDLYALWTQRLHAIGVTVYLDADGPLLINGVKAGPDLVKPNEDEFAKLLGKRYESLADIAKAARDLHRQGIAQVVVSLGARGALFVKKDTVMYANALPVPMKSTVGAGDATMAALIMGNERADSWEDTIRTAIAAGAASVMCEGTQAISPDSVNELKKQVILENISV